MNLLSCTFIYNPSEILLSAVFDALKRGAGSLFITPPSSNPKLHDALVNLHFDSTSTLRLYRSAQLEEPIKTSLSNTIIADFVASLQVSDITSHLVTATLEVSSDIALQISNKSQVSQRAIFHLAPIACEIAKICLGSTVVKTATNSLIMCPGTLLRSPQT
jgi:hypothetical protein